MKDIIQVAGVVDAPEAEMLASCGVDHIGFPLRLAGHKEDISERDAAVIIRKLRPPACAVLITYLNDAETIASFAQDLGTSIVQLHGEVSEDTLARLRALAPGLRVIKSLIVRGDNLKELKATVHRASPYVDAFITDTFDPDTGACGATGKTHDWSISRELVAFSSRPVLLAGGLGPDNVRKAILDVQPAGVDANTRLEGKNGRKSRELVSAFVSEAREAFAGM